jgi:FkbM family methyltransferase
MKRYGTNYGGWVLPNVIELNEHDTALCIGVGEDISFDLLLSHHTNCNVCMIDPTPRAKQHWKEIQTYYQTNNDSIFSGDIQPDYISTIQSLKPNFHSISFIPKAVSDTTGSLKFYKQSNPKYVSQSLESNFFTESYDVVDVDTIPNIIKEYSLQNINLIKLDIEGTEIKVLHSMIQNNILPKYLLVEFDLLLKRKDTNHETKEVLKLLSKFYTVLHNDNWNITFLRKV